MTVIALIFHISRLFRKFVAMWAGVSFFLFVLVLFVL